MLLDCYHMIDIMPLGANLSAEERQRRLARILESGQIMPLAQLDGINSNNPDDDDGYFPKDEFVHFSYGAPVLERDPDPEALYPCSYGIIIAADTLLGIGALVVKDECIFWDAEVACSAYPDFNLIRETPAEYFSRRNLGREEVRDRLREALRAFVWAGSEAQEALLQDAGIGTTDILVRGPVDLKLAKAIIWDSEIYPLAEADEILKAYQEARASG